MVDAGRRSTPNLIDPPPARVPVRQRGADSRIGIAQAFGSPRGDAAGGRVPVARPKDGHDADQQGFQAPRSRSYAQDGRSVYHRPRTAPEQEARPRPCPGRDYGGLRHARGSERCRREGADRLHVGALGQSARSRRGVYLAAPANRPVRAREVQGPGVVGADGHRGVRAHQGPARHRPASRWRVRGHQEQGVRSAAAPAVSGVQRHAHAGALVAERGPHGPYRDAQQVHADHLAGQHVGPARLHPQGRVKSPSPDPAREAPGQGGVHPDEAVLGRAARCARERAGVGRVEAYPERPGLRAVSESESCCIPPRTSPVSQWEAIISRQLRALHLGSIRSNILVFAVLATLTPTLVTSLVSYRQNRQLLTEQIAGELRSASSEAARELDLWLKERLDDLRAAASSYVTSENLAKIQGREEVQALGRLRDYLNSVRQRLPDHEALVLIDPGGRAVASSSGRVGGVRVPPGGGRRTRAKDGGRGEAYWDGALGKPAIVLAVPIRQADGRFLGAFTAKLNLRAVAELLLRLAPDDPQDVYLITDQGKLIIRSRVSSADLMRTRLPETTTRALLDREGQIVMYKRADGREVVGALRRGRPLRRGAGAAAPPAAAPRGGGRRRDAPGLVIAAPLAAGGGVGDLPGRLLVPPPPAPPPAPAEGGRGHPPVRL